MSTEIRRLLEKWREASHRQWADAFRLRTEHGIEQRYDAGHVKDAVDRCADELEALLASPVGQEELDTTCDNDVGRTCKQLWPTARPSWCCGCLNTLVEPVGQEEPPVTLLRLLRDVLGDLNAPLDYRVNAAYEIVLDRLEGHPPVEEQGGRQEDDVSRVAPGATTPSAGSTAKTSTVDR